MYFCDQVAYSRQIHEVMRQTNHSDWENKSKDTKSAEQSDENISRWESVKKGKGTAIGERQLKRILFNSKVFSLGSAGIRRWNRSLQK